MNELTGAEAGMTIKKILQRLAGVRRSGGGWLARCSAHADHKPSLSVRERDGKILLHCHAGCSAEDVVSTLGITMADLFVQGNGNGNSRGEIEAIYPYQDESGKVLFEVVREKPKRFYQRRPDGNGGYIFDLSGVRRVLYNLPEILKSTSVLTVEGERDVEAARSLGIPATCNPHGAGNWKDEYSESLRGKCVVIIPDADEPGIKHAHALAGSLWGKTESLKILSLPGQAKDLSDWAIPHGTGTRDSLLALIRSTPELTQDKINASMTAGFRLTSLRDLLKEPEESVSYVWGDTLPVGGNSLVSAKPKVGKSTLVRCLALAVACGESFLGRETLQGAVIYLSLEEKRSEVARHFRALGATGEEPILIHAAHAPQAAMLELCQLVKEHKPVLVIIDPLFKFVRVKDESAYAEICRTLEPLLILARETGTHVLLVHHSGKSDRIDATDGILGSTALFGGVDTAVILKKSDRFRTVQSVQRYGRDFEETVVEFDPTSKSLSLGLEKTAAEIGRVSSLILEYLTDRKDPATEPEINAAIEERNSAKRTAIRCLVEDKKVERTGSGKRGDPFLYSCPPYIAGTRKQATQETPQTRVNRGEMLVPSVTTVADGDWDKLRADTPPEFDEVDL